ncbi:hypothetical protein VTI74DRAFT_483 [Chaetomium olivicolor]
MAASDPTPIAPNPSTHKRKRSEDLTADESINPCSGLAHPPPRLVFMYANTILAENNAVCSTLRRVLAEVVPDVTLPESNEVIYSALSRSPLMTNILTWLGIRPLTTHEIARLNEAYVRIHMTEGIRLFTLAPGAKEFLEEIKQRGNILAVLVSNQNTAMNEIIHRLAVRELVGLPLPILASEAYATNPTEFASVWDEAIVPWFGRRCPRPEATAEIPPLQPHEALIVSRAPYDLNMAKAVGARACWLRMPGAEPVHGADPQELGGMEAVMHVHGLEELRLRVFGDGHGKQEGVDVVSRRKYTDRESETADEK